MAHRLPSRDFGMMLASSGWTSIIAPRPRFESGVNNDTILINSGSTRHRGFEGESSYDLLQLVQAPGLSGSHLTVSGNLQLLNAEFTASDIPDQVGKEPAFAPHTVGKAALTFSKDHFYIFRLSATAVSSQFFQDSNLPAVAPDGTVLVPAKIPAYWTLDFSAEYYITKNCRVMAGVSNSDRSTLLFSRFWQPDRAGTRS